MNALAPAAGVRARKHPLLVVVLWLVELLAAMFVVWPVATVVRATFAAHPRGDAVLWDDGGLFLLDFLARALPAAAAGLGAHVTITLPLAFVLLVVAFGAAIVTLGSGLDGPLRARVRSAFDRSADSMWALTLQSVLALAMQLVALVFAGLVFAGTAGALANRFGVATADRVALAVALPFALVVFAIGILRDLAAIQLLLGRARLLRSVATGFRLLAARPMLFVEYAARAAAGLGLIAIGAALANRLGGRGGGALLLLALVHQIVVGFRVALRVSWLAAAIRRSR